MTYQYSATHYPPLPYQLCQQISDSAESWKAFKARDEWERMMLVEVYGRNQVRDPLMHQAFAAHIQSLSRYGLTQELVDSHLKDWHRWFSPPTTEAGRFVWQHIYNYRMIPANSPHWSGRINADVLGMACELGEKMYFHVLDYEQYLTTVFDQFWEKDVLAASPEEPAGCFCDHWLKKAAEQGLISMPTASWGC